MNQQSGENSFASIEVQCQRWRTPIMDIKDLIVIIAGFLWLPLSVIVGLLANKRGRFDYNWFLLSISCYTCRHWTSSAGAAETVGERDGLDEEYRTAIAN